MGDILSHAEVEAILSAIQPSRPRRRDASTTVTSDPAEWERHDFERPQPLQGNAIKVIHALQSGICRRWQDRLQDLLPSKLVVQPVGACQSTAVELLASVPSSHVICQVQHGNSAAESLLIWSDSLARQLIASMLGGGDQPTAAENPLTAIELRLLSRLNDAVLRELATLLEETLNVSAVLTGLDVVPETLSNSPCLWFSFEVAASDNRGFVHLGIPGTSLHPPIVGGAVQETHDRDLASIEAVPDGIQQVSVQVSASLALLKLKAAELAALQVGDVVMTEISPNEPIALTLDGQELCQGTIGMHLGRKALRLATMTGNEPPRK
jgi:flagellar motor switch protein FliM